MIDESKAKAWCGNVCPGAGHCPHFGRHMTENFVGLCHTREDYRRLWTRVWIDGVTAASDTHAAVARRRPAANQAVATAAPGGCGGCGKAMPSWAAMGWNVASAIAAFVFDGGKTVSPEEYAARLAVCDTCESRGGKKGNRCTECGCYVAVKAIGMAWDCPRGKWASPR